MTYKNTFNPALVILFGCAICFFSNTTIRAQTPIKEKPKLKDFGSSIKPQKEKNKDNSESKIEKSKSVDDDTNDVIKIETRLVRTSVLVVNKQGKAIPGLKASDFIVTEDNIPQEIDTLSIGESVDVPKSIVLIIDYSESQADFIENSVEAAKVLVDKLNPKDRMAIVTDDVELLTGFTNNKSLLKGKLDSIKKRVKDDKDEEWKLEFRTATGRSLQFSALMATLSELFDEEDIRPIVIFQSDGDEAFSITDPGARDSEFYTKQKNELGINFTAAELFNRIEKSRATIYSVVTDHSMLGLSPDESIAKMTRILTEETYKKNALRPRLHKYTYNFVQPEYIKFWAERLFKQQTAMMIVARASGGFTESLENPLQADAIYTRILNDINNRYLIGYYPKNDERDGKRRNIKIEVRDHPEYTVLGRKTYLAPGPEK